MSNFEICEAPDEANGYGPEHSRCFENGGCPFLEYVPEINNSTQGYEHAYHECQMSFEEYWEASCCLDSAWFPALKAVVENPKLVLVALPEDELTWINHVWPEKEA